MKAGAPQGLEIAPAIDVGRFRSLDPPPGTFPKMLSFQKFPVHAPILDSQRPDVIVTTNDSPHTGGHDVSDSCFPIMSLSVTKINVKVRKSTDCTTACRGAIAPTSDIALRCNHSTSHVNESAGRRTALKSRQRAILVNLEDRTPHQRQYFRIFCHFEIFGCMHQMLVHV